eukprot:8988400-Heterocapsa_arctica.AAC.1
MWDLKQTITDGVHRYGTYHGGSASTGVDGPVYCYEVDGLGKCLLMDDANVPSLLSLPYIDPARA